MSLSVRANSELVVEVFLVTIFATKDVIDSSAFGHCAAVGFYGAAWEMMPAPSLELGHYLTASPINLDAGGGAILPKHL